MIIDSILNPDAERHFVIQYNDEVSVTLRYVPRDTLDALLRKATVTKFDRSHQKQTDFDHLSYGESLGRAAIVDWSGLEAGGLPYPCTPDNAALLMRRWTEFAKFVSEMCSDLEGLIESERETVRKNSVTTSAPAPITPA